ncbi:MAG: cytochrome c maturation protein CcmE [Armatimonadota bacterium]
MKFKAGPVVGLVVIAAALVFGGAAFVRNLTPYLPFAEARAAKGTVQVMGALDKTSVELVEGGLHFTLIEKTTGSRMPVVFGHTKPANFMMAIEITAIGRYEDGAFHADKLLVKCPSKYQGTETKTYGG